MKRLITVLLTISILASLAACGNKDDSDETTRRRRNRRTEPTEATGDTDPTDGPEVTATPTPTTVPVLTEEIPDTDDMLFKYTYYNWAWGYVADVYMVTCRGDIYSYHNGSGPEEMNLKYMIEYAAPIGHIDPSEMTDLYSVCRQIDPDFSYTLDYTACDMGEYRFTYVDPYDFYEVPLLISGDDTMVTDDAYVCAAQNMIDTVLTQIPRDTANYQLIRDEDAMINVPVDPELAGTHLLFEGYESFKNYCDTNGIDITAYLNDYQVTGFERASYIVMQVMDSNTRSDALLIEDNYYSMRFVPTLMEYEEDPAFDGKVTAAIMYWFGENLEGRIDDTGNNWQVVR